MMLLNADFCCGLLLLSKPGLFLDSAEELRR
jgi:hypothetical protein